MRKNHKRRAGVSTTGNRSGEEKNLHVHVLFHLPMRRGHHPRHDDVGRVRPAKPGTTTEPAAAAAAPTAAASAYRHLEGAGGAGLPETCPPAAGWDSEGGGRTHAPVTAPLHRPAHNTSHRDPPINPNPGAAAPPGHGHAPTPAATSPSPSADPGVRRHPPSFTPGGASSSSVPGSNLLTAHKLMLMLMRGGRVISRHLRGVRRIRIHSGRGFRGKVSRKGHPRRRRRRRMDPQPQQRRLQRRMPPLTGVVDSPLRMMRRRIAP